MVSKQWSVPAPVLTDCKAYNLTYIVEVNDYVSELSKLAPWTRKLLPTSYIFPTHTW